MVVKKRSYMRWRATRTRESDGQHGLGVEALKKVGHNFRLREMRLDAGEVQRGVGSDERKDGQRKGGKGEHGERES